MPTEYAIWLRARQAGIGGSDIPAILGLSPWTTRLEVYHSKVDPIPDDIERPSPHESGQAMRFWTGQVFEKHVAELFRLATGFEVSPPPRIEAAGIFLGQADAVVYDGEAAAPLEIKTTNARNADQWGATGSTNIPEHVLVQALFYGFRMQAPYVYVAVLIGGQDFRWYKIHRSARLEALIHEEGEAFWRDHVEPRFPPSPEFHHPATASYLRKHYDHVEEANVVELSDDILDMHLRKKEIAAQIRELKKEQETCQAKILAAMGNAEAGRFFDGSGYRAKMVERKGYTVKGKTFKDLRFVKSL